MYQCSPNLKLCLFKLIVKTKVGYWCTCITLLFSRYGNKKRTNSVWSWQYRIPRNYFYPNNEIGTEKGIRIYSTFCLCKKTICTKAFLKSVEYRSCKYGEMEKYMDERNAQIMIWYDFPVKVCIISFRCFVGICFVFF